MSRCYRVRAEACPWQWPREMHIRHARLQRIVTVRSVAARLVSHAASQHEQQVFDARLAVLQRTKAESDSYPPARRGTHLELLHLVLELVHRHLHHILNQRLHAPHTAFYARNGDRDDALAGPPE